MRTLADDIAADVDRTFLAADHFGEPVTYAPAGGDPREITAIVDREQALGESENAQQNQETIRVTVARDPESGIDAPRIGDALTLEGDDVPFGFSGEIGQADGAAWTLTFRRKIDRQLGRQHVRR